MKILTERLLMVPCTRETFEEADGYPLLDHIRYAIEQTENNPENVGWYAWFVQTIEHGRTVGDMGFKGKPEDGKVEIGYGISPSEQRKGYAAEGVKALIHWAFEREEVKEITAECSSDNVASIRVLGKAGMKREDRKGDMLYWSVKKDSLS